tara:strand:- start:1515 stop:2711 length:1197 start_codon:yes stop_codon:yes gene_type:complete
MIKYKTLDDSNFEGMRVLLRLDLNVPMQNGVVSDVSRIKRAIPTIKALLKRDARVAIISHFGRPNGQFVKAMSLEPLTAVLQKALPNVPVNFFPDCIGPNVERAIRDMESKQVILLENLRFYSGEERNDPNFAQKLANMGDVFVNDAFSVSHRAHASTQGVTDFLPCFAGPLMEAELEALSTALEKPTRPLTAIVGGAKVSTKIELLTNLVKLVDKLIIGGGMANTFIFSRGVSIGTSLAERELTETAKQIELLAKTHACEIILQSDALVAKKLELGVHHQSVSIKNVPHDAMILDAGPNSIVTFSKHIQGSKTVLWNGPLGAFEIPPFNKSTLSIARLIADLSREGKLVSIAGGGDTLAALNQATVTENFNYVSTAGGAFLEWLEGKELPGVAALRR